MRRLVLTLGFAAIVVGLVNGCEVESPDLPQDEPTKNDEKPILGGSQDTAHDAVVWLYSTDGFACTGTIIHKNGSTGYVLTAGHCDGMDYVVMDDDISCFPNNCDGLWEVEEQVVHAAFNENDLWAGYDFSMIRFIGANASTPVIPCAGTSDGVVEGSMTDMVGYGVTENGDTNLRMHVIEPVDQLDSFFLAYNQMGGTIGTCQGDSGGPAILNNTVVGVTSFGDQGCVDLGVSGRVKLVYNDFIAPFIGGQVIENCDTCFTSEVNTPGGECYDELDSCFTPETSECAQLVACFNECGTNACYDACADDHPGGITKYNAIVNCGCTACATLCADDCEPGSTAISVVSSGNGINTGGAAGIGGDGSGAASSDGGSTNSGGAAGEGGGDGDVDGGPCDCATVGSKGRAANGDVLGLAGLALALGALRRRSSRR